MKIITLQLKLEAIQKTESDLELPQALACGLIFDQLKNSGNFRLIRNMRTSNMIMSYFQFLFILTRLIPSDLSIVNPGR